MIAKRFKLIECNGNIEDDCTQNVYDGGEDVFELLDLLNSFNDENEQLKQVIEKFVENPTQHNLWKLRTILKDLKDDDVND